MPPQTASEIGRRKMIDSRTTRARNRTSGTTLSRSNLFDFKSVLSSCTVQLLISAIILCISKRLDRESVELEVSYLTLTGLTVAAVVGRKVRRPISEAVTRTTPKGGRVISCGIDPREGRVAW